MTEFATKNMTDALDKIDISALKAKMLVGTDRAGAANAGLSGMIDICTEGLCYIELLETVVQKAADSMRVLKATGAAQAEARMRIEFGIQHN